MFDVVITKRADSLSRFLRPSVQHVAETAVEPCLARCVVMFGFDRFVVDMRKVAAEARDLLHQAALSGGHQFSIALIPQLVSMGDRSRNTAAVGLDGVPRDEFRIEGW